MAPLSTSVSKTWHKSTSRNCALCGLGQLVARAPRGPWSLSVTLLLPRVSLGCPSRHLPSRRLRGMSDGVALGLN